MIPPQKKIMILKRVANKHHRKEAKRQVEISIWMIQDWGKLISYINPCKIQKRYKII